MDADYSFALEQREFKDDKNKTHSYVAFILTVGGNEFSLFARPEDKKLLNYILEQEGILVK